MTRELPADLVAELSALPDEEGPFNPQLSLGHLPMAGHIVYSLDPQWIRLQKSGRQPPRPTSSSRGRPRLANIAHPVSRQSLDWQESDRVLAGIMTAFGVADRRRSDRRLRRVRRRAARGVQAPAHPGTLKGERFRAWDVVWGTGRAELTIENSYVFVTTRR